MIVKFFWYIFSLLIILLVVINAPTNNSSIGVNPNIGLSLRSNKLLVQQIIGMSVFIFLLLTVILLL